MQIKYFKSTWGMTESSIDDKLKRISEAGYDGVEAGAPDERREREEMAALLSKYHLLFIGQQWTSGRSLEEHKSSFERQFNNNMELNPVQINSHTGKDYYTKTQNVELIKYCNMLAADRGIKLTHETHRGRFSFCASSTAEVIGEMPELRLTADFSHWCCVSESMLEDQSDLLERIYPHCDHLHARIGHEEGPQVSDPKAPEWKYAEAKHLEWWTRIVQGHEEKRDAMFPITVEFGPPNYMVTIPFSKMPVTDLWEANLYMREMLKTKLIAGNHK